MESLFHINISKYETDDDLIKIRFKNEDIVQIKFSKLFKVSEYLQDKYKYSEAKNIIQNELLKINKDIGEESIKYFIELVEEEEIDIPINHYSDIYTLSEYFCIPKITQELDNLSKNKLYRDLNFTLQILIESEKKSKEIESQMMIKIEKFLSLQINECLKNPKFKELSNSTISRIIERSQKLVNDELLFEFIISSASSRFILIKFVSLDKLRDEEINEMIEFIEKQDEETRKIYLDYMPFNLSFIKKMKNKYDQLFKEMKETKEKLAKEEISYEKMKEKFEEEIERLKITINLEKEKNVKLEILLKENEEEKKKKEALIEKLQYSIKKVELDQNKNVINQSKSEMRNHKQDIFVAGYNKFNQLGEKPNNKDKGGSYQIISPPLNLSIDPSSLQSYSIYDWHSVQVTSNGSLKGIGYNDDGRITSSIKKTRFDHFTNFCMKDGSGHQLDPVSAVCYRYGTLYMFSKTSGRGRQLVLCDEDINMGDPVFLDIGNHHPVALFGGFYHSATIGREGEVIFINRKSVKKSPKSLIKSVSLPEGEKASSVACCEDSVVVLSSNGRVFLSSVSDDSAFRFSEVLELVGKGIVCVSGTREHVLAVSKEGRVFGRGSNEDGKLGLGEEISEVSSFVEITSLVGYEIRAAYAGGCHSLFETREGKILSCGDNYHGQLLLSSGPGEPVYSPTETTIKGGATFCIAGNTCSVVLIGGIIPQNTPNVRIQEYE